MAPSLLCPVCHQVVDVEGTGTRAQLLAGTAHLRAHPDHPREVVFVNVETRSEKLLLEALGRDVT